jgi:hypothetical protein
MAEPTDNFNALRHRLMRLELLNITLMYTELPDVDPDLKRRIAAAFQAHAEFSVRGDREYLGLLARLAEQAQFQTRHQFAEFESRIERSAATANQLSERLGMRIAETSTQLERLRGDIENRLSKLREERLALQQDIHHYLIPQSFGLDLSAVPLPRFLPIRVYLSDGDDRKTRSVSNAVRHTLKAFGFEVSDDFPEETGSWWKKWIARSKQVVTHEELIDRLKKIERAIEVQTMDKPQSEINKNEAEAVAALVKSVESVPNAAFQLGTLLFVKTTTLTGPCIQAKSLTQREILRLEKNSDWLRSPQSVLAKLAEADSPPRGISMLTSLEKDEVEAIDPIALPHLPKDTPSASCTTQDDDSEDPPSACPTSRP